MERVPQSDCAALGSAVSAAFVVLKAEIAAGSVGVSAALKRLSEAVNCAAHQKGFEGVQFEADYGEFFAVLCGLLRDTVAQVDFRECLAVLAKNFGGNARKSVGRKSISPAVGFVGANPLQKLKDALMCCEVCYVALQNQFFALQFPEQAHAMICTLLRTTVLDVLVPFMKQGTRGKAAEDEDNLLANDVSVDMSEDDSDAPPKKRSRSRSSSLRRTEVVPQWFASTDVGALISSVCRVVDLLALHLRTIDFSESFVVACMAFSVPLLFLNAKNVHSLQMSALNLLLGVCSRKKENKVSLIEHVLGSFGLFESHSAIAARTFSVGSARTSNSIHIITALFLLLAQNVSVVETNPHAAHQDAIRTARLISSSLLKNVVEGGDKRESISASNCADNVTAFITVFCEDLALMFLTPEWPVAEIFVQIILSTLFSALASVGQSPSKMCVIVDAQGILVPTVLAASVDVPKGGNKLCPYCSAPLPASESEAVLCVCCEQKYHTGCSSHVRTAGEDTFLCSTCGLLKTFHHSAQTLVKSFEREPMEQDMFAINGGDMHSLRNVFAFELAACQYMTENKATEVDLEGAKQFFIQYMCLPSVDKSDKKFKAVKAEMVEHFTEDWKRSSTGLVVLNRAWDNEAVRRELAVLSMRTLFKQSILAKNSDKLLLNVVACSNSTMPTIRCRAVKALASIIRMNPRIISDERIIAPLTARLRDTAISVRQACVDLLGNEILACRSDKLFLSLYDAISERLSDIGVSVRKQAVKIFGDMCTTPKFTQKYPSTVRDATLKLAARLTDIDSISKTVLGLFDNLWFSRGGNPARSAEQIVDVCAGCRARNQNLTWLTDLVTKFADNEENMSFCQKLCRRVTELVSSGFANVESDASVGPHINACFNVLSIFSTAVPGVIAPLVGSLLPYLSYQASNFDARDMLVSLCTIILNAMPEADEWPAEKLRKLEDDLVALSETKGMNVVQASMRCLCIVVEKKSNNLELLQRMYGEMYGFLRNTLALMSSGHGFTQDENMCIMRNLFRFGMLCMYFDFTACRGISRIDTGTQTLAEFSFDVLRDVFAQSSSIDIKTKAVQAIGYVCARQPSLAIRDEVREIYDSCFVKTAPAILREAVIGQLTSFLSEKRPNETEKQGIVAASSIAQFQAKKIMDECFTKNARMRMLVASALECIVMHGIINPSLVVPHLITLHADPVELISSKALSVLQYMNDKYPEFIKMKLFEGITMAYEQLKRLWDGRTERLTAVKWNQDTGTPSGTFGNVIHFLKGKKARMAFAKMLVKPFEFLEDSFFDVSYQADLHYLLFAADVICFAPFVYSDEAALVLLSINKILLLRSDESLKMLKQHRHDDSMGAEALHAQRNALAMAILYHAKNFLMEIFDTALKRKGRAEKLSISVETTSFAADRHKTPFFVELESFMPSETDNHKNMKKLYKHLKELVHADHTDLQDVIKIEAPVEGGVVPTGDQPVAATPKRKRGRPRKNPL